MKSIRMLIVEDEKALLSVLKELYRAKFKAQGFDSITIEESTNVDEARKLAKEAATNPYDLVSLDVALGDTALTGLHVLETLKRFQSAWMVALLTGVETDKSVDVTMGKARGTNLRKQLRREAYSRFPAERLLVVEKPSSLMSPEAANALLSNRLEQIAAVYSEVGRLRYIFRPIRVVSLERVKVAKGKKAKFIETACTHWQIRFNCGDIRTLPDKTGFRTLHRLLSLETGESLTPEEALLAEPEDENGETQSHSEADPVAAFFKSKGIEWDSFDQQKRDELIRAALSLKFNKYVELREIQEDNDLSSSEEDELNEIILQIGPLADIAETAYQRMKPEREKQASQPHALSAAEMGQNDLHTGRGNYDKLGEDRRGYDSPEAALFRARKKRVYDRLRGTGFADFAQHLDFYLKSTGANWSYTPPSGVEWTTE